MTDVLLLPSYREGFPNVLLEASAMGVPCAVSNVNGCNEIITDGYNGWIFEPRSACEVITCISRILSLDKNIIIKYGSSARMRVEELYDRSKHNYSVLNFYRDLIENV